MKFVYFLSFLCCAVLFNSCSTDSSEESSSGSDVQELVFTAPDFKYVSENRTSLVSTVDGAEFKWSEGDTVGIFPNSGNQVAFSMKSGAGTKTASFDGGGWSLKSTSTYAAYYPLRGDFYLDKRAIPLDYTGQTQTGNASTSHLGAYDYMGAIAKTPANGKVTFEFQHLGALVQLNIPLEKACDLTSMVLHTDESSFVTKGSLNLSSSSLKVKATERSEDYTISLENMSFSATDQTAIVSFMLSPVNLSGKEIDVILSCANRTSLKYVFAGENFEAGLAYSVIASLSSVQDDNAPVGVEAVDLGLPSGIKWASCNVGATKPEEYGGYYAWGEIEEKEDYSPETYLYYKYVSGDIHENQNWINIGSEISGTEYDVAYVKWGGNWRMPTSVEFRELITECTRVVTNYNGVKGFKLTGPNGNSIFLPFAGYRYKTYLDDIGDDCSFWVGNIWRGLPDDAVFFYFHQLYPDNYNNSNYEVRSSNGSRETGNSVRPVSD